MVSAAKNLEEDPLITAPEARKLLGDITATTFWRWERDGILPEPVRIRNRKYHRRSTIQQLAAQGAPGSGDAISGKRAPISS